MTRTTIRGGGMGHPYEELATAPKCVGHAIVECVPASLAEVAAFRRRWLHEDKEPSAADDWRDWMHPRRANLSKCCQVGRGGGQTFRSKCRQIRCPGMELTPTWHESHSVSSRSFSACWLAYPSGAPCCTEPVVGDTRSKKRK